MQTVCYIWDVQLHDLHHKVNSCDTILDTSFLYIFEVDDMDRRRVKTQILKNQNKYVTKGKNNATQICQIGNNSLQQN